MKINKLLAVICLVSLLSGINLISLAVKKEFIPTSVQPTPIWGEFGLEISNTIGNTPQQNPNISTASDGNFLVAWEDGRNGFTGIYLQKITPAGVKAWGEGGVLVSTLAGNQALANLIEDGQGGVIVAWQDYRSGSADIYAQHLSAAGAKLWGDDGLPVCTAPAGQFAPELTTDGAGGAIIVWYDYRSGSGEDIYGQRVDGGGAARWKFNGLPICETAGTQWYPRLASDRFGGAIIVWTDGRASSADNNIMAQRVDGSGKLLWDKGGLPICQAEHNQEHPLIMSSDDGAFIAWNDARSGSPAVYLQKIGLDGAAFWKKDGVPVSLSSFSQSSPSLDIDGGGGVIVAWSDEREEAAAIYAQRLSNIGKIAWEENGRLIAKGAGSQKNPLVIKLNTPEWLIVWEDARKESSVLFAKKINDSGVSLWPNDKVQLSANPKSQEKAAIAATANGSLGIIWQDRRNGNWDIFGQRLSAAGDLVWPESGLVVCSIPGLVIHQNVKMVDAGNGTVIMAFEDARSGYLNIYAQKISADGTLLWGKNALPVAKVRADQTNPVLAADGAGGVFIAWEDKRNPAYSKVYIQHILSSGKKVWPESFPLSAADSKQSGPLIISDSSGGAIIVWQDERNSLSLNDLYSQRISGRGDLLWGRAGLLLCGENGDQTDAAVVPSGDGGLVITWADYRRGDRNPDIYAQKFDGAGQAAWQKDGVLVCGAPDVQRTPQIAKDKEGNYLIVWTDKGSGSYDIYGQRLSQDGNILWMTDGVPLNQSARTQQNPQLSRQGIIIWEDYRYGNWDIAGNAFSPQGKLLWGDDGLSIVSSPLTQYAPHIADWDNGNVIVTWEDYRQGKQYEVLIQMVNMEGKTLWQNNGVMVKTSDGARAPRIISLPEDQSFVVVWEDYTNGGKALCGQKFILE